MNRRSKLTPSSCINSSHLIDWNPTRELLEIRLTIAILKTSRSGPGLSLKLVGYSIASPKNHWIQTIKIRVMIYLTTIGGPLIESFLLMFTLCWWLTILGGLRCTCLQQNIVLHNITKKLIQSLWDKYCFVMIDNWNLINWRICSR